MALVSDIIQQSQNKKMNSVLIPIQPLIGELTYIVHPLTLAFYSTFGA
jgi:hypothetical protein